MFDDANVWREQVGIGHHGHGQPNTLGDTCRRESDHASADVLGPEPVGEGAVLNVEGSAAPAAASLDSLIGGVRDLVKVSES
jgi:hypothetical protein